MTTATLIEILGVFIGGLITVFIGGVLTAILGVQGWMLIALVALKVQVAEVRQSLRDCQKSKNDNQGKCP